MTDPRIVVAMTMKPVTDKAMAIIRANLAWKWNLQGGGPYVETTRTEDQEIQGEMKTLTYVQWDETDGNEYPSGGSSAPDP